MPDPLERLGRTLGYTFTSRTLLETALRHRSAGEPHNERLEYLGDSLLNFLVAEILYKRHPDLAEGDLSRMRAALVKGVTLAKIANEIELGSYLTLGQGELRSGGFRRDSILADALEAVLAAVYLDGGMDPLRLLIDKLFTQKVLDLPPADELKDPKTRLQEYLQGRGMVLPTYTILETRGKVHEQVFRVSCHVEGLELVTEAEATGRRKAEQSAASKYIEQLLVK